MTAAAVLIAFGWTEKQAESGVLESPELGKAATMAAACGGCHGKGGDAIVGLDTRSADEIQSLLMAYKADAAGSSVMHRISRGYSEAQIRMIAAYLAAREGR